MRKTILTAALAVALAAPCRAQVAAGTVYPAMTNAPDTFYYPVDFRQMPTVNGVPISAGGEATNSVDVAAGDLNILVATNGLLRTLSAPNMVSKAGGNTIAGANNFLQAPTVGGVPVLTNGAVGPQGPAGTNGAAGAAATIAAGNVYTNAAGSAAGVTNRGTASAAIFDFTIPVGPPGPAGPTGPAGSGVFGLVTNIWTTNTTGAVPASSISTPGPILTNAETAATVLQGSLTASNGLSIYQDTIFETMKAPGHPQWDLEPAGDNLVLGNADANFYFGRYGSLGALGAGNILFVGDGSSVTNIGTNCLNSTFYGILMSGGSVTPWLKDEDAAGHALLNVSNIVVTNFMSLAVPPLPGGELATAALLGVDTNSHAVGTLSVCNLTGTASGLTAGSASVLTVGGTNVTFGKTTFTGTVTGTNDATGSQIGDVWFQAGNISEKAAGNWEIDQDGGAQFADQNFVIDPSGNVTIKVSIHGNGNGLTNLNGPSVSGTVPSAALATLAIGTTNDDKGQKISATYLPITSLQRTNGFVGKESTNLTALSQMGLAQTNVGQSWSGAQNFTGPLQKSGVNVLTNLGGAPDAGTFNAATATSASNSTNFFGQLSQTNFNAGSGATSSTYLKGDGTWGTPSGSGDVTKAGNNYFTGSNNFSGVTVIGNGSSISTSNLTVLGSSPSYFASVTSTNGVTNLSLTASRPVVTDANKAMTSGSASGAVPVNADGSSTTAAQLITALTYTPATNTATATFSGVTNTGLTASRMALTDANKAMVSATASGAVPINADGSTSTAAQVVTLLGTTAVNRATGDASGNSISGTYAPLSSPSLTTPNLGNATATSLTNSAATASTIAFYDANKKLVSATTQTAVPIDGDGTATTAAQLVTVLGTTAVNRATGDASGNTFTTTYAPIASPAFTGTLTYQAATTVTNTWTANTALSLSSGGTNYIYVASGTITVGITGIGNIPSSSGSYGILELSANGNTLTFTNVASARSSDYLTSRVITNTATVMVSYTPGQWTNITIVQYK